MANQPTADQIHFLDLVKYVFPNSKLWVPAKEAGTFRIYSSFDYLYNGIHPKSIKWGYVEVELGKQITLVSDMPAKGSLTDMIAPKLAELKAILGI